MIKKTLKYGGIAIVCLIIVTLASALLYRKYLQHEVSEARAICARFIVRRWSSLPTRSGKNVRVERLAPRRSISPSSTRSEEHTSELQSRLHLVCRLLLEKKK